ncbi:MAG: hypothetical protein JOZ95_10245 [Solirubrobacterales bacterium]|nr:hypothetical protein [Solirubrobacterales bacterium]
MVASAAPSRAGAPRGANEPLRPRRTPTAAYVPLPRFTSPAYPFTGVRRAFPFTGVRPSFPFTGVRPAFPFTGVRPANPFTGVRPATRSPA